MEPPSSKQYHYNKRHAKHQEPGKAADADSGEHVSGSEVAVVFTDVGFVEEFPEVVMRSAKAAVEDACEGSLGITAVGQVWRRPFFQIKLKSDHLHETSTISNAVRRRYNKSMSHSTHKGTQYF